MTPCLAPDGTAAESPERSASSSTETPGSAGSANTQAPHPSTTSPPHPNDPTSSGNRPTGEPHTWPRPATPEAANTPDADAPATPADARSHGPHHRAGTGNRSAPNRFWAATPTSGAALLPSLSLRAGAGRGSQADTPGSVLACNPQPSLEGYPAARDGEVDDERAPEVGAGGEVDQAGQESCGSVAIGRDSSEGDRIGPCWCDPEGACRGGRRGPVGGCGVHARGRAAGAPGREARGDGGRRGRGRRSGRAGACVGQAARGHRHPADPEAGGGWRW